MPTPRPNEKEKDFINRCIPYVIKEGTTKDTSQAAAVCHSIWRKSKKSKNEESDMKKDRVLMHLSSRMFKPLVNKDKPDTFSEFDRATLIVGDGTYNGIYFPAEELEKAYLSWEKQPINLDHSDSVMDEIGFIKNVMYDKVNKKITAKPILNPTAAKISVAAGYINGRIAASKIPEVSIGVWADRNYELVDDEHERLTARNLEGDHLALVTRGACSPEAGCGIGLTKNNTITIQFEDYVEKYNLYEDLKVKILKEKIKEQKLKGGKN